MTKTNKITTTALLVALAICFQSLRYISPAILTQLAGVLLIGSLVNLVIFVAVARVGAGGAVLVSVVTPLVAVLEGHLAHIYLAPAVAIGNTIIVAVWWLLHNKLRIKRDSVSIICCSTCKFLFLWWAVPFTFKTFLYSSWNGKAPATKVLETLTQNMSWPQLITALIGGFLAIIILRALPKSRQ